MKLFKSTVLGLSLAISTSMVAHAQDQVKSISSAEKGALATVAAIDISEILVSIVAENKKVDSDVTDFAEMMVEQHGNNLTQILEMEAQFKTGSLSGGESERLVKEGKAALMKLAALQGKEFETAYANAMVTGHEAALKLIDDKLMKTAKSEEVKKFLTDTRAAVEKHLEEAKKLQEELKS